MKKIAFSYIRMSSKEQIKGDSRRRQVERSKQYAIDKGYDFRNSIEDIGVSAYKGKNFDDGELGKFLQAAKDGQFDPTNVVLLLEAFDRFSRQNTVLAFDKLLSFIKTGITIETILDGQQYSLETMGNDIGKLYTAVGVLSAAHGESQKKSDRLKQSWENKRRTIDKKPYTGRTPAWLKLNKSTGEIVAIEHATRTILKIFELSIDEDMGASSIARYLNENIDQYPKFTKSHIKNRSKSTGWYESYIKKILNNKAVYGHFQPHKMVEGKQVPAGQAIPDYFPAIMGKERYDLAQAKMKSRNISGSGRKGEKFSNIFTRLIICGSCGGTIRFIDKGKSPKGGQYLICTNSNSNNGCDSPSWRYDDFEETFIKEVRELPLDELLDNKNAPHLRTKLADKIKSLKHLINELDSDHENVRKLMRTAQREGNTLRAKGYDNDLSEIEEKHASSQSDLSNCERELASLEARLKKRTQLELVELYNQMKETKNEPDLISLRRKMNALIRSVTTKITIFNNFNHIPAWEALDADLPSDLLQTLRDKGYKTDSEIEIFFQSDYGRRLFNQALREIRIHFTGGGIRVCRPAKNGSYKMIQKVRTFIDNEKKRSSEQLRKYKKRSKVQFKRGQEISAILDEYNELEMFGELQSFMDGLIERDRDALSYFNETSDS